MTVAIVFSLVLLALAAILRAGLTSAIRTNRADALRAAADGRRGAAAIAHLLEERDLLHPSINAVVPSSGRFGSNGLDPHRGG